MMLRLTRKALTGRLGFLAAGATLMYLYDPDRGRARRTQAAAQAGGAARRQIRHAVNESERRLHYAEGQFRGAAARARGGGRYRPESDVDLREHLRQVIRSQPTHFREVSVDVARGHAVLRGEVPSAEQQVDLRAAVAAVEGVDSVEDLTHLPGQPAPNKAAARAIH